MRATNTNATMIVPSVISVSEIAALAACVDGKASPSQAKLAMEWVMREGCRMTDLSFQLGGDDGRRASDFAEGRKWPGHMIRAALNPETHKRAEATRGFTTIPFIPPKRPTP